jgi:hypothetical protein
MSIGFLPAFYEKKDLYDLKSTGDIFIKNYKPIFYTQKCRVFQKYSVKHGI